ncbi:hypothetical protein LguiB_027547 [Lonicera macranthoides]
MRSELKRELIFLVLQFLEEENYKEAIHKLERESGCFLNTNHLEELVLSGQWEEVERYLLAFTKAGDNNNSAKIFFEIQKQKYLEALDSRDLGKAVKILSEELRIFAVAWEDEYKELNDLLTKNDFRFEHMVCHNRHPGLAPTLLMDHDCRRNLQRKELEGLNLIHEEGWRLTEINGTTQFRSLILPSCILIDKIAMLVYTNSANGILLLAENGIHQVWKWSSTPLNSEGKANTKIGPKVWAPESGMRMINDLTNANLMDRTSCFALAKNSSYLLSTSGGPVSLFNTMSFAKLIDCMEPPPVATALAFHPRNKGVFVIGMDDATIQIYDGRLGQVIVKIVGHLERITGLAFSHALNLLVSTAADSEIITWESGFWIKQKHVHMRNRTHGELRNTRVQFHLDERHFLAVDERQLAIYKATNLDCDNQPTSIAANPEEVNQFAVGMSDGKVFILEPCESNGQWGVPPPVRHHASTSRVSTTPLLIGSSSLAPPWLI